MKRALATLALAGCLSAPAAAQPAPQPDPSPSSYWGIRGCGHGHKPEVARKRIRQLLKNHVPLTEQRGRRVQHYVACTSSGPTARKLYRLVRQLREWRRTYAHRWPIEFNRLPVWAQGWAWSTGACESGNSPATATGNGYYGAFQFLPSTWWAAGGTGLPSQHSWHFQAVIAVRWMYRAGAGQWPVCG